MSQKTNTMIKLALVFTVAILSFCVGIFTGKMFSDNQHKLAQLEPQSKPASDHQEFASGAESAAAATDAEKALETATSPTKETTLTDSEVAKIAEEFASDDSGETSIEEKPIATVAEHSEKEIKSVPATVNKAAAAKATPKSLTASAIEQLKKMETEQRTPASIPIKKEILPMHFTVQVGSFPTEFEAQKMTKDLLGKGFKTSLIPAQVNGQTWFRVNVGLFGSVKEAQDYKKDFLEKTQLTSAFVQKVQK
ncbi:MAG: SPOR domain-containing protein [Bdellovibrio sp.]|nr:SPOR domain-containing protein [Bdellovibrio sp.]